MTDEQNELSFWGWGKNPQKQIQSTISKLLTTFYNTLGIKPDEFESNLFPRPVLSNILLNPPRFKICSPNSNTLNKKIESFTTCNKLDRLKHSFGRSAADYCHTIANDFISSAPDYISYPKNESDIELLLKYCNQNNIQLLTYGGGTSVVKGFTNTLVPNYKGVIICNIAKHMNRILSICEKDQTITVQAGVTSFQLERYLKLNHPSLTLRYYPQSFEFATFGGLLVTKSGGHFSIGNTRLEHFIQCASMITPNCGKISSVKIPSSGSGPNVLQSLFHGSEGIFGIVTEMTIKLLRKPLFKYSMKIEFDGMDFIQAADYVREIVQSGLHPSNCRLISGVEACFNGLVNNPNTHALIVGFESHLKNNFQQEIENISEIVGGNGKVKIVKNESKHSSVNQWSKSFMAMPYIRDSMMRSGLFLETFETCVLWSLLPSLHQKIGSLIGVKVKELFGSKTLHLLTQRFTHVYIDGVCVYYTLMIDPRKEKSMKDYKQYLLWMVGCWSILKQAIQDCLVLNGASATHHHGIGIDHGLSYVKEIGMKNIQWILHLKKHFDPNWILNPGILVPYSMKNGDMDELKSNGLYLPSKL